MQRKTRYTIPFLSVLATLGGGLGATSVAAQDDVREPPSAPPVVVLAPASDSPEPSPSQAEEEENEQDASASAPDAGEPMPSAPSASPSVVVVPSAERAENPSDPAHSGAPTIIFVVPAPAAPTVAPATASAADAPSPPDVPEIAPPPASRTPPRPRRRRITLSIGYSGVLSGSSFGNDVEIHASFGTDFMLRLTPWLYVGARRIGFASASPASGERMAVGGSPMLGLALGLGDVAELFGEAGAAVQSRFGGQIDPAPGVAPFAGLGVRFHVAEWVSIGVEGTLTVPVTDAFLISNAVLPRGAVSVAGGAGVTFHIR